MGCTFKSWPAPRAPAWRYVDGSHVLHPCNRRRPTSEVVRVSRRSRRVPFQAPLYLSPHRGNWTPAWRPTPRRCPPSRFFVSWVSTPRRTTDRSSRQRRLLIEMPSRPRGYAVDQRASPVRLRRSPEIRELSGAAAGSPVRSCGSHGAGLRALAHTPESASPAGTRQVPSPEPPHRRCAPDCVHARSCLARTTCVVA